MPQTSWHPGDLSLLPPLSHKKQRHCCNLLYAKDLASPRQISSEFTDFVGRKPDKVIFSVSELVFFDSLH